MNGSDYEFIFVEFFKLMFKFSEYIEKWNILKNVLKNKKDFFCKISAYRVIG